MTLKNVLKGFLAIFFVISGTIVAMPTFATTGSGSCTTVPSPSSTTLYQMQKYFSVSYSRSGDTGTATVKRLSSTPLCNDQAMVLESFSMGPNWNGGPDGSTSFTTSLPQTMAYATHFTFGKNDTSKTVTVKTPNACKGTQLDTYVGDQEVAKIVNIHDGENREIGGKIFQATGTCEIPVKYVDVCDATTGKIKSVPEADASKYEKANSDKCVEMKVCVKNSGVTTLQTITKDKYDSTKYSTNPEDCKKPVVVVKEVKVCDTATGNIISVPETDKDKYAAVDSDDCKVRVCDVNSHTIKLVPKASENSTGYEAENSLKCAEMKVCVKNSGVTALQTITKDNYDSTKYSTNPDDCKKPVTPVVATPETPAAPQKIASTGPEAVIGGFASASALSYGAYSYLASRRAVRNAHRQ